MRLFGSKTLSNADVGQAASEQSQSDGRSDVWDELMTKHGHSADAHRHQSRHDKLHYTSELAAGVTEAAVAVTVLDTLLNVPGSGANLWGTELPTGGEEAAEATAGIASGVLGSIFNA